MPTPPRRSGPAAGRGGARGSGRTSGRPTGGATGRPRTEPGSARRSGKPAANASGRASSPRSSAQSSPRPSARSTGRPAATPEERRPVRAPDEPRLPEHIDLSGLERSVRAELRSLSKPTAEIVGGHLLMAGEYLESDPRRALAHARAARARASRVAAVREVVGVAAYHAEEWAEALTELRTARRISGDPHTLPLIADAERALGRPQRALALLSDPDVRRLDTETRAELLIVVAGARRDLGQLEAALSVLARGGLDRDRPRPGSMRLWYAYADALEEAGRPDEAATWFAASAALDVDGTLDAAERAAALL